jgi:hypothetical protein
VPDETFNGTNLGTITNELIIISASASVSNLQPKILSTELWWKVERIEGDVLTPVLPALGSPRKHFVVPLRAQWDVSGTVRTGEFSYTPTALSDVNILDALGPATGASYIISIVIPLKWTDSVQTIVRYDDFQTAEFVY